MSKNEKTTRQIGLSVVCGVLAFGVSAATEQRIPDGGTWELGSAWANVVCEGSATLSVKPTQKVSDGSSWLCQAKICATNGTVALDFSAVGDGLPVLFSGDLRADGKGHVVFKGNQTMLFGTATARNFRENDFWAAAPKLGIAAATVEATAGFHLVLTNMASVVSALPTSLAGNLSVADGARVLTWAANGLAPVLGGTGEAVALNRFDVCAMTAAAFGAAKAVAVGAGRTLAVKPMRLTADWNAASSVEASFTPDIVLSDATASLLCRNAGNLTVAGAVSGAGHVAVLNNGYGGTATFTGTCSFAGPLSVEMIDSRTSRGMRAVFADGCVGWSQPKDVTCETKAGVSFLGGKVSLGRLVGCGFSSDMTVGASAQVAVQTLGTGTLVLQTPQDAPDGCVVVGAVEDGAVLAQPDSMSGRAVCDFSQTGRSSARVRAVVEAATYVCHVFGAVAHTLPEGVGVYEILSVTNGATVSVRLEDLSPDASVSLDGGTVQVVARTFAWDEEALLHLDASAAETLDPLTDGDGNVRSLRDVDATAPAYPYVHAWRDVRSGWTRYRGENSRAFQSGSYDDSVKYVYAHAVSNALNGKTCLSCADARKSAKRMPIVRAAGADPFKPAWCTLVFGSRSGGGRALVGAQSGCYARNANDASAKYSAASDPLTTNANVLAWLNGQAVVASQTGLSGGWDIVSLRLDAAKEVTALGWNIDSQDGGGQEYAEVLFFARELSDVERRQLEAHLARKWGLDEKYTEMPTFVVSGAGTLRVTGDCRIEGVVHGSVHVEGGTVSYEATAPALAADVEGLAGRVGWFDPDDETRRVLCARSDRPLEVNAVFDRLLGAGLLLRGNNLNAVTGQASVRAPHLNIGARGFGPVRAWLDYSNCYAGRTSGNYLKVSTSERSDISSETCLKATDSTLPVRMAFVVSDSFRGGGTPVLDSVSCTKKIANRTSGPIWAAKTDASVTGGTTWLDGRPVDGTATPFSGGPELFAFSTTETLDVSHEGFYDHSEGTADKAEMLGESIYFNRVLAEGERRQVESYLMWKWLGTVPPGQSNFTDALLSGSSDLCGVPCALLPRFADDYVGTVTLTDTALAFTVVAGEPVATDALVARGATVVLPEAVSLTVRTPARLKWGRYVLLEASELRGATDLSASFVGASPALLPRLDVVRESNRIVLTVQRVGGALFIR